MERFKNKKTLLRLGLLLFILVILPVTVIQVQKQQELRSRAASTDANLKVAFIGDDGTVKTSGKAVLNLIKSEGASFVIDGGDLDYQNNPTLWDDTVTSILGAKYPYFVTVGNHDVAQWPGYRQKLQARLNGLAGLECDNMSDIGNKSTCKYRGLYFILSGIGAQGNKTDHENYIKTSITSGSSFTWKLCVWHHNMKATQVGGKSDVVGWTAYEECRKAGFIISNAHEHSYSRTKTLIDIQNQIVDPDCPLPKSLCVALGKTFLFVSGLGGESIRDQTRCLPSTYPYGCKGEWASIYSSTQGAKYGALFIIFNYNGNPNKAHGYFKDIAGNVIDEFDITAAASSGPTPTPGPTGNPNLPECNNGLTCTSCSAPNNTCGRSNGRMNCSYTKKLGGGSCNSIQYTNIFCVKNNCTSPLTCQTGVCR